MLQKLGLLTALAAIIFSVSLTFASIANDLQVNQEIAPTPTPTANQSIRNPVRDERPAWLVLGVAAVALSAVIGTRLYAGREERRWK